MRRHDGARGGRLKRWWRSLKRGPRQLLDLYRGTHEELEEAEEQTKERIEGSQQRERPENGEGREERASREAQRERAGAPSEEEAEPDSPSAEEEEEAGRQPAAERSREQPARTTEAPQLDRLLLPIVGGEEDDLAVEAAFSLARSQSNLILEVLGLVGDRGRPDGGRDTSPALAERDGPSVERVTYALLRLAERAQAEGLRLETELLASDRPVDAIMERARGGADLIIVSRPSGTPSGALISPQDVERLSQESPCPVVVVD